MNVRRVHTRAHCIVFREPYLRFIDWGTFPYIQVDNWEIKYLQVKAAWRIVKLVREDNYLTAHLA